MCRTRCGEDISNVYCGRSFKSLYRQFDVVSTWKQSVHVDPDVILGIHSIQNSVTCFELMLLVAKCWVIEWAVLTPEEKYFLVQLFFSYLDSYLKKCCIVTYFGSNLLGLLLSITYCKL